MEANNIVKHLEMIQAIIARMSTNSFQVKAWSITLASGFLGFAAERKSAELATFGLLLVLAFWAIDGYYLRQERLFRCLYDTVRKSPGADDLAFSLTVTEFEQDVEPWSRVVLSLTVAVLHGSIALVVLIVIGSLLWGGGK